MLHQDLLSPLGIGAESEERPQEFYYRVGYETGIKLGGMEEEV